MIKVGVLGGESPIAGELIRLLLHHPEVELKSVISPSLRGRALSSFYRGIVGDTDLRFSDVLETDNLDVLFIASSECKFPEDKKLHDDLRVIMLQEGKSLADNTVFDSFNFVPGVSEMFRKPLVRGAKASKILDSATTVSLIVLFPLALHLLLNDDLRIRINLPKFRNLNISTEFIRNELESLINSVQLSFNKIKEIEVALEENHRAISVEIEFPCGISEEEIGRIYEDFYDDHNFTFLVKTPPSPTEVAGTHKCLIYISKPNDTLLKIKAVADSVMRGGAGDAIHAMNLLFGLFEKTGLSLPASFAYKENGGK